MAVTDSTAVSDPSRTGMLESAAEDGTGAGWIGRRYYHRSIAQ